MTNGFTQTIAKAFFTALILLALVLAVGPALAADGAARIGGSWASKSAAALGAIALLVVPQAHHADHFAARLQSDD